MATILDEIWALAVCIAASHHLEVVDVEFLGGAKFRTLKVFIEKDEAERTKLKSAIEIGGLEDLPSGISAEMLSGVTHEDCVAFTNDFGTLLDVEDLIPGAEYTLEVSSPGLERKLVKADDYSRFTGNLVKVQMFSPVNGNRHWTGRLVKFMDGVVTLDAMAGKQKAKGSKTAKAQIVLVPLENIEKANLVAEI